MNTNDFLYIKKFKYHNFLNIYPIECWRVPRHAIYDQLFATCWEMLLQVFGFVYLCLMRVRVGFAAGA